MKWNERTVYCFNCGTQMTFTHYDEYGTCFWVCPHCGARKGDQNYDFMYFRFAYFDLGYCDYRARFRYKECYMDYLVAYGGCSLVACHYYNQLKKRHGKP